MAYTMLTSFKQQVELHYLRAGVKCKIVKRNDKNYSIEEFFYWKKTKQKTDDSKVCGLCFWKNCLHYELVFPHFQYNGKNRGYNNSIFQNNGNNLDNVQFIIVASDL